MGGSCGGVEFRECGRGQLRGFWEEKRADDCRNAIHVERGSFGNVLHVFTLVEVRRLVLWNATGLRRIRVRGGRANASGTGEDVAVGGAAQGQAAGKLARCRVSNVETDGPAAEATNRRVMWNETISGRFCTFLLWRGCARLRCGTEYVRGTQVV